jgi:hypothetical protein
MLLLQPLVLAILAIIGSALVGVAILRLVRAQAGRRALPVWQGKPLAPTLGIDDLVAPVWVHRLHADGLPSRSIPSEAARRPVSQRFVDRWHGVTNGN